MEPQEASPLLPVITDSPSCQCDECRSYCQRPCWPVPHEIEVLEATGKGSSLMLDWWEEDFHDGEHDRVYIVCPATPGYEGEVAPTLDYLILLLVVLPRSTGLRLYIPRTGRRLPTPRSRIETGRGPSRIPRHRTAESPRGRRPALGHGRGASRGRPVVRAARIRQSVSGPDWGLTSSTNSSYTTPMDATHDNTAANSASRSRKPVTAAVSTTAASTNRTRSPLRSSWVASVSYRDGFLVLFLRSGEAILHGPDVPAWVTGLLTAGRVGGKDGRLVGGRESVGRAYNRLVRGRWQGQRVSAEEAREIRRMMR